MSIASKVNKSGRKLDFVCVGASKSGTTTIHDILKDHSEIWLPESKETQFFVKREQYEQGIQYYYDQYFKGAKEFPIWGEVCPQYMSSNKVHKRIETEIGPKTKIIIMARDPIDRLYSHFNMKTRSFERENINTVIQRLVSECESEKIQGSLIKRHLDFNLFNPKMLSQELDAFRYTRYIYPGKYASIYRDYVSTFGENNVLVCFYEDLTSNSKKEITAILKFLEADSDVDLDFTRRSNTAKVFKSETARFARNFLAAVTSKVPRADLLKKAEKYQKIRSTIDMIFTSQVPNTVIDENSMEILKSYYMEEVKNFHGMLGRNVNWPNFR